MKLHCTSNKEDMCFILGYMDIVRYPFDTVSQSANWIEDWVDGASWNGLEELLMEYGAGTELSFWRRQ